ncbi:MAG TPA: zinc ribbon domain-containing protein [Ktedonobacteraceae bacterium]|nr:zinc ribbon domain-containing protein [Ktedonobacteraceae bacterium]
MEQVIPPHCPRCGAEAVPWQRFCPNCGLSVQAIEAVAYALPQTPIVRAGTLEQGRANETIPITPRYKLSYRTIVLFSLIMLLLLGVGGWQWYSNTIQPPITSRMIRAEMPYAGLTYLIKNVAQSQYFLDDPLSDRNGMIRVFLQTSNPFPWNLSIPYSEVAHLVLPGGSSVSPLTITIDTALKAGAMQKGYLDFSVPIAIKIAQLTFQLGSKDETAILLPLSGHADLSKYAPHESPLHATLQYQGLNWTLHSATSRLGMSGQQAKKGMRYLTIALSVANPLSQIVIPGSPFDYMRLQVGVLQASPHDANLPVSFAAGTTGTSGSVTFVVPQGSNVLTFLLLAQPQSGFAQAAQTVLLPS